MQPLKHGEESTAKVFGDRSLMLIQDVEGDPRSLTPCHYDDLNQIVPLANLVCPPDYYGLMIVFKLSIVGLKYLDVMPNQ